MRHQSIVLLIVLLAGLAGCQKQPASNASAQGQQQAAAKPTQPSPWKMSLSTEPPQPASGADVLFRVKLTDQAGAPVSGADAKADLKSSLMDMGKNVVPLSDRGNGTYEGKGRFTMTGPWDVVLTASKDGKTGTEAVPVVVRK